MTPQPAVTSYDSIGLVLGGGGARGLAAIGILDVMQKRRLRASAIAGTSMGAMVGAFLAAGHTVKDIDELARRTSLTNIIDFATRGGLMRGDRFEQWLAEHLPARFEDLEIPLVCTATDIDTGELIYLREGDLPTAIRATCAFPGAFAPVRVQGRNLVDGGLKSTVPVQIIRAYAVDRVIACDFQQPLLRPVVGEEPSNQREQWQRFWEMLTFRRRNLAADVLLKAVDILQTEVCRHQFEAFPPDVVIRPPMPDVNIEDFRLADEIIRAGAEAAELALGPAPGSDP